VVKGSTLEGLRFRHPWIDRDSVGVLGDYVTLDTGTGRRAHRARPRLGRLPHRGQIRPRDLLPGGRGGTVPARGRALRGPEGVRREPEGHRLPAREGRPARIGQGDALLPHLLALQEPHHLPRHRAMVHRPRHRRLPRAGARRHREGPLVPGLGRGAHPQHDRVPAGLVHLAPAPVGRAHPRLLLQGLLHCAPHGRDRAPRGRPVRGGQRRRLVGPRGGGAAAPGLRLPGVRRARSSTRRRTSSTSGSTPAPRTRPSSRGVPGFAGRPTCTSRAATSIADGSTRRS
jgi:hypothetical protein